MVVLMLNGAIFVVPPLSVTPCLSILLLLSISLVRSLPLSRFLSLSLSFSLPRAVSLWLGESERESTSEMVMMLDQAIFGMLLLTKQLHDRL
jgi:hypothetical protein